MNTFVFCYVPVYIIQIHFFVRYWSNKEKIANLDDDDKILIPGNTITGFKEQYFLTENGLYELIFLSRKPLAKQFKKWIKDVIKEIRLKGKYDLEEKLKQKEQELLAYKQKTYEEIQKNWSYLCQPVNPG